MHPRVLLVLLCLGLGLTSQGCHRKVPKDAETEQRGAPGQEVYAAWYDVPVASLAKRRAGLEKFTAAHNRLPIGTLVRVTHLAHDKSVVVRITDRGITQPKVKLDLCKEAASELGMLSEGIARVRMQVLTNDQSAAPPESHTSTPQG